MDKGIVMKYPSSIKSILIAPCGMNCALCIGYLRKKKPCPGCYGNDNNKPKHCVVCKIKNCEKIEVSKPKYCFKCEKFPCARLKQLDKRYRTKYGMSMIKNLENIRESGIRTFLKQEKQRWTCQNCDGIICVHRENCLFCGQKRGE